MPRRKLIQSTSSDDPGVSATNALHVWRHGPFFRAEIGHTPSFQELIGSLAPYFPLDHLARIEFLRDIGRGLRYDVDSSSFFLSDDAQRRIQYYAKTVERAADVLDRCGENPAGTFAELMQRVEAMTGDRRRRYIDGLLIARHIRGDGWDLLRQMLASGESRSHPFYSWTEYEWEELETILRRSSVTDQTLPADQSAQTRLLEWDLFNRWQELRFDPEALIAMLPTARRERTITLLKLRRCIDNAKSFDAIANVGAAIPYDFGRAFATQYTTVDHLLQECAVQAEPEPQALEVRDDRRVWEQTPIDLARRARTEHPYDTMTATELARKYLGAYIIRKKNGEDHSVDSFAAIIRKLDTPNSTVKGRRS
jgi:hypothetical protein